MRRPLRVAVLARAVTPLHGVGGLERSVNDLVRHLAAHDVDVTLVTPPPAPIRQTDVDPFAAPHITVRHVSYVTFPLANRPGTTVLDRSTAYPVFGLRAGRLVRSLVHDGRIDVVHGFGASVLGYALARSHERAPLVFNPQGLEEFGATADRQPLGKRLGYWPLQRAVRICSRAADCVIATDAALAPTVVRHLHVRPDKLRTIPNGIDFVHVNALAGPAEGRLIRERHGIAAGETVLLSVGRLEHNKGFDLAVAALAQAAREQSALVSPGWRWVACGSGSERQDLERAVAAHGLGSHVIFTGRTTDADLHAWYEAATLFVHPTRYEGSSLVTLEAMAHRKPIVATRAGGLPDKVRPGENGWLVEPDDARALAAAIEEAVADPVRLIAMGTKSRQIVEREFSWSVLIQRYLDLYEDLLSRQRPQDTL
jgi:glycosyltransferase involved in cell wall biosynthesis